LWRTSHMVWRASHHSTTFLAQVTPSEDLKRRWGVCVLYPRRAFSHVEDLGKRKAVTSTNINSYFKNLKGFLGFSTLTLPKLFQFSFFLRFCLFFFSSNLTLFIYLFLLQVLHSFSLAIYLSLFSI
jgi:hypothetical protein